MIILVEPVRPLISWPWPSQQLSYLCPSLSLLKHQPSLPQLSPGNRVATETDSFGLADLQEVIPRSDKVIMGCFLEDAGFLSGCFSRQLHVHGLLGRKTCAHNVPGPPSKYIYLKSLKAFSSHTHTLSFSIFVTHSVT